MVNRKLLVLLGLVTLATTLAFMGCSSDDPSTPTGNNNNNSSVTFTEFGGLVEQIAPPVYVGPQGAPQGALDSIWTDGSHPLLGKVFGEDEPMSLYSNVENLDDAIEMLTMMTQKMDSAGITGDTTVTIPEGGTVEIRTLASPTTIPTQCQSVMGFSAIDLDDLVRMVAVWQSDTMYYDIGYTLTDSTQTLLTYFAADQDASVTESFLYYAYVNLVDSTIDIRGVFFKDYGDYTSARWVYNIETVNESDFSYRMSWYSDDAGGSSLLGCVIGGGNKDDQFAMKYRQYYPADTAVVDSSYILDQMFNSSYEYLGDISAGYETYVNEANIFTLEYQPTVLIQSPWAE
ncbi:MAG: hypothetical protein DRP45_03470 [Candidatus Zixiibacteriota bacterium]|nr:MAG: hypothetical protein DRP45_03470 [candidate division Zixibacteria bacterium]